VAESTHRRNRRRGALLVLCSLCLLAQPVVGNGPGPDPQTVYSGAPVDLETESAEGELALHPAVNGDFVVAGTVRMAANGSFERPASNATANLRALLDAEFYWDSTGEQYYAVDATLTDESFRLTAERVAARTVAETLAVPAAEAPAPAARAARAADHRAVIDRGRTAPIDDRPTLVETDGEYVFVTRSVEAAPDPLRVAKLASYALAGAGLVAGTLLPVLTRLRPD
jgi:hypothetical protein